MPAERQNTSVCVCVSLKIHAVCIRVCSKYCSGVCDWGRGGRWQLSQQFMGTSEDMEAVSTLLGDHSCLPGSP